MTIAKIGDTVSFVVGSGWEASGHVGRVVSVDGRGATMLYDANKACTRRHGDYVVGSYEWDGLESPLDHVQRIANAIKASQPCPHCGRSGGGT